MLDYADLKKNPSGLKQHSLIWYLYYLCIMALKGVPLARIAQGPGLVERPLSQILSVFMAEQENSENSHIGH